MNDLQPAASTSLYHGANLVKATPFTFLVWKSLAKDLNSFEIK
ncbi:hypothetical protein ADICYQ_4767 [Cyclobacterium qasimii M12-11B]|uniref:Uncharacterized protein n=1 Tax=Cyclobacterium qasimii M12-11B TaxID=641524 RepID=S7WH41_9BACT|nr:hypothetical protein ADICYQ_4767 [Cyclobacterium qasimii M12-11B]